MYKVYLCNEIEGCKSLKCEDYKVINDGIYIEKPLIVTVNSLTESYGETMIPNHNIIGIMEIKENSII